VNYQSNYALHSNTLPSFETLTLSVNKLTVPSDTLPLDLFTPLAQNPWAIWLDSGQSQHVDACFDILVWQPEVTLCTYGNETNIHYINAEETYISNDDPLSLLEAVQNQVLSKSDPSIQDLPFLGGALGYFSYDLGRRFEKLPNDAERDIALPEMAMGIYSQAIIFDHKSQQFYLVCPQSKREALEAMIHSLTTNQDVSKNNTCNFTLTTSWQSNMDKASYTEKFEQVQSYLLSGDCYQINLAQRFKAHYKGDEFEAYCALRLENKAPFSAFMRLNDASILSVSPERFLQCKQHKVQSKPIKGTMPRSNDKAQDRNNAEILANSSKDRAENLMIVDLLRNDISKVCKPNSVRVPKLFDIESFPAVHHLVSTVEGELAAQYNANDLLRGAFPGGSITGAPKIRAMQIIEQLEPHRRSVYCGSIGYISSCGNMDTSITIRTLICESNLHNKSIADKTNKIYCWAGGGLVADSNVSSEFQETYDKVNRILPVLTKLGKQGSNSDG
jgi:para-aminobenzoate synthetase component 1